MKCINCIYYPCMRLECEENSNCEYFRSIIETEINRIIKTKGDRLNVYN